MMAEPLCDVALYISLFVCVCDVCVLTRTVSLCCQPSRAGWHVPSALTYSPHVRAVLSCQPSRAVSRSCPSPEHLSVGLAGRCQPHVLPVLGGLSHSSESLSLAPSLACFFGLHIYIYTYMHR